MGKLIKKSLRKCWKRMDKKEYFDRISVYLESKLRFLDDKPEETIESTVKSLWFKAAGIPVSAERAITLPLPDLSERQLDYLNDIIKLRVGNTPLAYITGRQNFMGIELLSDKRALIPRKETELLGNKALDISKKMIISNKKVIVMDVCCGCGNLGISVANYNPDCIVYASDISTEAVELTQENINLLNLGQRVFVQQADMMSAFEKQDYYNYFDMIMCNPPYISSSKVTKMDKEISINEPKLAFDGGMLGTKIIQKLIIEAPKFLKKKGWLVFEVGSGQGQFIAQLCERAKTFSKIETTLDDSDTVRVISARK
jgi:release factor glutamine methyltransferase